MSNLEVVIKYDTGGSSTMRQKPKFDFEFPIEMKVVLK